MDYKEDAVWVAMADKTRRDILSMLEKKRMSAGEIAERFNISKPSISHHLNILKQSGLIESEKQGQNMIYKRNPTWGEAILAFVDRIDKKENPKKLKTDI